MKNIQLLSLALIPIILTLSVLLFKGIYDNINEIKNIKLSESKVISKLKLIRKAQKAYYSKYNEYASDWNTLIEFIKNDTYHNISIIDKSHTINGVEFTKFEYDTLSSSEMISHLFPSERYPNLKVENLPFISDNTNKKFNLFTDKINQRGVMIDVIEVVNPYPVDPKRNESNIRLQRRLLKFGSKNEVTLNGNW